MSNMSKLNKYFAEEEENDYPPRNYENPRENKEIYQSSINKSIAKSTQNNAKQESPSKINTSWKMQQEKDSPLNNTNRKSEKPDNYLMDSNFIDGRKSNKREEEEYQQDNSIRQSSKMMSYSPKKTEKQSNVYNNNESQIRSSNFPPINSEINEGSLIKRFTNHSNFKKGAEEPNIQPIMKNINASAFKEIKKNNNANLKSLFNTSTITNNLGEKLVKTSQYDKILQECKSWNKKYVDPEFPPDQTSLSKNWAGLSAKQQATWKKFVWRRADEIFEDDYDVFYQDIEPNDIRQGQLGDCYLLSSLSSLAERPFVVKKIFNPAEKSSYGLYSVWLNVNGLWKNVIIDDYFPCLDENSGPAFSRANGNELWVLILEKAYAKVFGSYHVIEGGNPAAALRDVTGAPYENKDEGSAEEIWEYIKTNDHEGFILTCYTKSTMIVEEENDLGLLSGHAYAILDCQEVVGVNGPDRIIKIRNPWGKVEWKGKWSDNSNEWTSELKRKLNLEAKDDGTFWINIEDFRNYYEGVGICKFRENYLFDSINLQIKRYAIVKMVVPKDCYLYLSLNQKDERMFMHTDQIPAYSFVRLFLAKILPSKLLFLQGDYREDQVLNIESNVSAGEYLILIEIDWMQAVYDDVVLSTYSETHVELEQSQISEKEFLQIQRNLIKSYALTNPPKQKKNNLSKENQNIQSYVSYDFGLLYFYYTNQTKDTILEENIQMTKLVSLKAAPPINDGRSVEIILAPGQEAVILYKYCPSNDPSISYSYKTSPRFNKGQNNAKNVLYPEIYQLDLILPKNQRKISDPELGIKSENNRNNSQIKNSEIRNKEKSEILGNKNVNVEENKEEPLEISQCEMSLFNKFEQKSSNYIERWGLVYVISLIIAWIFSFIACFLRPDFLNVVLICLLVALLISQKINQNKTRKFFYLFLFAFIQDLVWLILYTSNWVENYIYEPSGLNALKNVSIVFSYLNFIFKIWIIICTWRFSIAYDKMKGPTISLLKVSFYFSINYLLTKNIIKHD